ncbi:hypothetical protein NM688_g1053 [Phlebia brevispora]|uniref:Uncharacterized protein n=1 Tax=Phlebia brevispora TaxID=194682 RepID=A0ACC1TCQ5_9APHY|nr:hypothetical protein NM688_g1053 [Phlebia brevispora]
MSESASMLRIGVDVGGTNTDGVLIDIARLSDSNRGIIAHYKAPTTADISSGIEEAVRHVLYSSAVSPSDVSCVSIGTTAFINAVLEADVARLSKVAVTLIQGHIAYIDGGYEIDGREIAPIKPEQVIEQCNIVREKRLKNIVISGIFSPLDNEGKQEAAVRRVMEQELGPGVNIVCSREVGQIGMLERENASILNAAILTFAQRTIAGFQRAIRSLNLTCPLYLTQNDGTLTSAAAAARLPIRTFASGPTNSMRGAAFLAGMDGAKDNMTGEGNTAIVVDVGGTTTDVGVLMPSGFPRQAAAFIEIGGVRTNFAMADVQSIGLGGGSRVKVDGEHVSVGPESVGHYLTRDALVFGGKVLTATDIIVAGDRAELGDKNLASGVSDYVIEKAGGVMKRKLEMIIDKMKTSPDDVTLLLVGGGSIIVPDQLSGVAKIIRPPFFSVANAVGAAMAKVAGEVDTIEILQGRPIDDVIGAIKAQAIERAIRSGADPDTTRIVEVANLPVQYVTNQATRIIVKAAGDLAVQSTCEAEEVFPVSDVTLEGDAAQIDVIVPQADEAAVDIEAYKPTIASDQSWILSELDLEWIADGCGVLGTGGGGSPYPPFLVARQLVREGKMIRVIDAEDVPEDAVFVRCTFMGSPSVSNERLQGGNEIPTSIRQLLHYMRIDDFAGTISDEIGGGNGIQPMIIAAEMGKPVLDADLMGRAYPNMYQSLPGAYNIEGGLYPCAISDGIGNTVILPTASSPFSVEHILRTVTTEMGSRSGVSMAPLTRRTCQSYGILRTVSQAWRIGRAIALCRKRNTIKSIPRAILALQNGTCLFVGKIVNVHREVRKGFTWGNVTIAPLRPDEEEEIDSSQDAAASVQNPDDILTIPFQNENLYAVLSSPGKPDKLLVTVPDLITVLDSQSGGSLGTQDYRYGLRVTVIAMAGDPKWTATAEGLACGGPSAFGLNDVPFTPIAQYKEPQSVITEYA